jgi:cytochrome P450
MRVRIRQPMGWSIHSILANRSKCARQTISDFTSKIVKPPNPNTTAPFSRKLLTLAPESGKHLPMDEHSARTNMGQITGPKSHWFYGNVRERNKDAIKFFSDTFDAHGDFYRVRFLHIPIFVVSRASLAKEILHDRPTEFIRKRIFDKLSTLLGYGLLTSEGERWRKRRKLIQPAFHQQSLNQLFEAMVAGTEGMLLKWEESANDAESLPRDISDDFMKVTLRIVSEALFGFDTAQFDQQISDTVSYILPGLFLRLQTLPLANLIPNKKNREYQRQLNLLNNIIHDIIEKRRVETIPRKDLLGMLMAAVHEDEPGIPTLKKSGLSNEDLRDEVMTMFLAGHETTANGLAWTLHLLADHPEVEMKMCEEINRVLGSEQDRIRLEQLRELSYTRMVFEEAIRLYPPIWAIPRTVAEDTTIAGVSVKKNAIVSVNTFLLHRNPDNFKDPLKFDPERFSPVRRKEIDRYAYLPFAAGPHTCIGNQFALMEAQVILTGIYRKFRPLRPKDEAPIRPYGTLTLRPEPAIRRLITLQQHKE